MKKYFSGTNLTPEEQQKPELQIAQALVEARQKKHVTQQQLAERTGIAQADISRLENGNSNPTLRTLQRLADGLEMMVQVGFQELPSEDEPEEGTTEDEFFEDDDQETLDFEDEEEFDDDEDDEDDVSYFPFAGGPLLEDEDFEDDLDDDDEEFEPDDDDIF